LSIERKLEKLDFRANQGSLGGATPAPLHLALAGYGTDCL
jgi:hypothetical protein